MTTKISHRPGCKRYWHCAAAHLDKNGNEIPCPSPYKCDCGAEQEQSERARFVRTEPVGSHVRAFYDAHCDECTAVFVERDFVAIDLREMDVCERAIQHAWDTGHSLEVLGVSTRKIIVSDARRVGEESE